MKTEPSQLGKSAKEMVLVPDAFRFISGSGAEEITEQVRVILKSKAIEVPLAAIKVKYHDDGECYVQVIDPLEGCHVFVFLSLCPPRVNDRLMQGRCIIDAVKREAPQTITVVAPYMPYQRQERRDKKGKPISAVIVAQDLSIADRVITAELHAVANEGFFSRGGVAIPVEHIRGHHIFAAYLEQCCRSGVLDREGTFLSTTDLGGIERVRGLAREIEIPIVIVEKQKDQKTGTTRAVHVIAETSIRGKTGIVYDDIIGTAGTMLEAQDILAKNGANRLWATGFHGVFCGNAIERLESSGYEKVLTTDSIEHHRTLPSKFECVPIAPYLAFVLRRIFTRM